MTFTGAFQRDPRDVIVTDPTGPTTIHATRLQGSHFSTFNGGQPFGAVFGTFATIADPIGGTTALRFTDDNNSVYHLVRIGYLHGNGNFQGLPGEVAGGQSAVSAIIKANTSTKVDVVTQNPAGGSGVDRFDLTTGNRDVDSGLGYVKIEPFFPDAGASGWWRIYTYNLRQQNPLNAGLDDTFRLHTVNAGGVGWNAGSGYAGASNRSFDVWMPQFENANAQTGSPFPLVVNTPANLKWGDTCGSEQLAFPLNAALATPAALTAYTSWLERGNVIMANAAANTRQSGIMRIGDIGRTSNNGLEVIQTATGFTATFNNAGTTSVSSVAVSPTQGQRIETRVTLSGGGAATLSVSINGAAETAGTAGAAAGLPATWSEALVSVNGVGNTLYGDMDLIACKVLAGAVAVAACRTA